MPKTQSLSAKEVTISWSALVIRKKRTCPSQKDQTQNRTGIRVFTEQNTSYNPTYGVDQESGFKHSINKIHSILDTHSQERSKIERPKSVSFGSAIAF